MRQIFKISLSVAVILAFSGGLGGCARAQKKSPVASPGDGAASSAAYKNSTAGVHSKTISPGTVVHRLNHLIPYTVRVRRPLVPGADPQAGPGGTDYQSDPLPNAQFDCETPQQLFRELKLDQIRTCLSTVKSSKTVNYVLKRVAVPYLELKVEDQTPPCLKEALPRIPVPREIIFQSNDEGPLHCYSARLDIEANEVAGLKLPTHRLAVKVDLPLHQMPQTDEEFQMRLLSWALTPLWWNADGKTLDSRVVPDFLCKACIGEKQFLKPNGPPPTLWP